MDAVVSDQQAESKKTFDKFLKKYKDKVRNSQSRADDALYNMLSMFRDEIHPLVREPHYFHKAFRQIDVVTSFRKSNEDYDGCIDSVIYDLIHASELFWPMFCNEFLADDEDEKRA